jgi:hypothetical protein
MDTNICRVLNMHKNDRYQGLDSGNHWGRKQNSIKKAGCMAQAVEHLSSKCEVLCSNPSTAQKKILS